jgi:hypothetical protein
MFCRSQSCSLRLLARGVLRDRGEPIPVPARTPQEIEVRNRTLAAGERGGVRNDCARDVHSMLNLPDYSRWLRSPSTSAPCGL